MTTLLAISQIECLPEFQARESLDQAVVVEYAEAMKAGAKFPAVVVFCVGWMTATVGRYICTDGFHRVAGAKLAGFDVISAEIREGDERDARLHALGANATHGLRRTTADKRKAVTTLLMDAEWSKWSNRAIAKHLGIDDKTVASIRNEVTSRAEIPHLNSACPASSGIVTRKGSDGKTYRISEPLTSLPDATVKTEKCPASGVLTPMELEAEIARTVAELMARVPESKRHYVAGQLRARAWEHDPEEQEANEKALRSAREVRKSPRG